MKKNKIIFWIATIIIALMEGVMPLVTWIAAPQYMTVGTKALGYPDYFAYTLIVAKILGVIAIVYPKTPKVLREWAYAGFTFNLIFAAISHIMVDQEVANIAMPIVVGIVLGVSYFYSQKIKP
ncbi:DoxX-like family protein [Spirosomataceae bacterium TFI 002]|nr:DoxX-like family protein [Spirosomataceae bacterium TFI 002]